MPLGCVVRDQLRLKEVCVTSLMVTFCGGSEGTEGETETQQHSVYTVCVCVCVCVCACACVCVCVIIQSKLPKFLWTYAVHTAAIIRNRCFSNRTKQTPYFMTGKQPINLTFLGCTSLG